MSLIQDWAQSVSDEMALKDEWELGEYVEIPCPNCNRMRLCECDNGKHRCEKCNWVPENNEYCEISS